jgi:hypothetical protein
MTLQYAKTIRKKLREPASLAQAIKNKHFLMAQSEEQHHQEWKMNN